MTDTSPGIPGNSHAILESISDGVFTVDRNWRVTYFNPAAEAITGVPRAEALGRPCPEVFKSDMCESSCPLRRTMETGDALTNRPGYLVRPDGRKVPITVSTALLKDPSGRVIGGAETFRDLSELEALRERLQDRRAASPLRSSNPAMIRLMETVPIISDSTSTLLISGETGTGKEVLARTIHQTGPRSRGPFVALNCGALPDSLLESELFGYRKGAFTGADRDRPGRFAAARGGTIFLDEIGEVSPAMQVRLLRVLQDRSFEALGSNERQTTDARIICATHRDLEALMLQGRFRQDLYYRIHVLTLRIPPLRERQEDLLSLAESFVERFNRSTGRTIRGFTAGAWNRMVAHDWPGNIRELENMVERAFVLCRNDRIDESCLFPGTSATALSRPEPPQVPPPGKLRNARVQAETALIRETLDRCGGNHAAAARELEMHRSTLYRKLARMGETGPRDNRD